MAKLTVRLKHLDLIGLPTSEVQRMLTECGIEWRTAKAWADHANREIVYEGEPLAGVSPEE